jgi:hypothetical protein
MDKLAAALEIDPIELKPYLAPHGGSCLAPTLAEALILRSAARR